MKRSIRLLAFGVVLIAGSLPFANAQQRGKAPSRGTVAPQATPAPAQRPDVSRIPIYAPSSSGGAEPQSQPQPQVLRGAQTGRMFAALQASNHKVNTLSGETLAFNRVLGEGRPTVIIFWSTYCGVCYTALDDWQAVYERYAQQGLNVLALNVQDPSERDEVKTFMRNHHLGFPVYFAPQALHTQLTEGRLGTPVTFVFDREGNLAARLIGWTRGQGRQALSNVARDILAE